MDFFTAEHLGQYIIYARPLSNTRYEQSLSRARALQRKELWEVIHYLSL